MSHASLPMMWFQLLALLALEAGLIALVVLALKRLSTSSAWLRTLLQAAIAGVLLLALCELSGYGRSLGGWVTNAFRKPVIQVAHSPHLLLAAPSRESSIADTRFAPPALPSRLVAAGPELQMPPRQTARAHRVVTNIQSETAPVSDDAAVLLILLVWASGFAYVTARASLAQFLFIIFRSRRRAVGDAALLERIRELANDLKLKRRVRVVESGRLTSPIAFGLLRPTIGLPKDFSARFDEPKRDVMLAHELAHLAAHDPFWCLMADFATAVLWWHPAVWWMRHQLRLASELAADEASLLISGGPRVLAECLVELGGRIAQPRMMAQLGVSGFRSNLGCRVQRLIHLEDGAWSPPSPRYSLLVRSLGAIALVTLGFLCTAWVAPNALSKGGSMNTIRENWKRSLATFTLLAAASAPDNATTAQAPAKLAAVAPASANQSPDTKESAPAKGRERTLKVFALARASVGQPTNKAPVLGDLPLLGRLFRSESGNPKTLQAKVQELLSEDGTVSTDERANALVVTDYDENMQRVADLIAQLDAAETPPAASPNDAFRRRYGLVEPDSNAAPAAPPKSPSPLEAKLKDIVLTEVSFDGLPLSEVLRFLNDQALKADKENIGINFLISQNPGAGTAPAFAMPSIDPATGLPIAVGTELIDMSQVTIKFSLPLKHVTLKNVLDAIVKVADQPIEYTVEDYAVVFSPKPQSTSPWRRMSSPRAAAVVVPVPSPAAADQPVIREPRRFNIDFGVWRAEPSQQVGPAAAGQPGDFWNTVGVPNNDHHIESGMNFATGEPSAIQVEMINLGGAWGNSGLMRIQSPVLDSFNYPVNNQGGNSQVILHSVPAATYDVYIYGHGAKSAGYYGDYTLTVGKRNYGRKSTTRGMDAERNTKWVEGSQYVKFSGVKVGAGEKFEILIKPGAQVSDEWGRTFADAMICGLQFIPVK